MKRITFIVIPGDAGSTRQYNFPKILIKIVALLLFTLCGVSGFFVFDYLQLREIRESYHQMAAENEVLKGEARILVNNLEEVKKSLRQVQDYTAKLSEMTRVKVQKVRKRTGIGPLTREEFETAKKNPTTMIKYQGNNYMPLGINIEKLAFRPVFDRLDDIGREANQNVFELQHLISTLSKQKSLLASIPSISPVNGWIASGFGYRISPFTGERAMHNGIDIAAPIGTPILAPADGVVIFTGAKAGFGNFIMVAHGYGIVTAYGHNAQNMVLSGQKVQRGEQIATVGLTGRTTGPHLHYEVWVNGKPIDPRKSVLTWNGSLSLY